MRHILLSILMFFSLSASAQFYLYEHPSQQRQVEKEKYRAPRYRNGKAGLEKFMLKNYDNPSEPKGVEGKVVVAVIVNEKGKVAEAQIVRSVSHAHDAEALRVVKLMKFKPAKLGKKKTKARIDITFPINHGRLSFLELRTIDV